MFNGTAQYNNSKFWNSLKISVSENFPRSSYFTQARYLCEYEVSLGVVKTSVSSSICCYHAKVINTIQRLLSHSHTFEILNILTSTSHHNNSYDFTKSLLKRYVILPNIFTVIQYTLVKSYLYVCLYIL